MSWGVQLETYIYVSSVRKDGVKDKIEENNEIITMYENEIAMMVSANPREIVSDEGREHGDVVEELRIKLAQIWEPYKECIIENRMLYLILEEIDKAEDV